MRSRRPRGNRNADPDKTVLLSLDDLYCGVAERGGKTVRSDSANECVQMLKTAVFILRAARLTFAFK